MGWEGRDGSLVHKQTHTPWTPCGTEVNHNLVELTKASRELGGIIYGAGGGWGAGEEWRLKPIVLYHITGWRRDTLAVIITCQSVRHMKKV